MDIISFIAEDVDETIECISSKLLNSMSTDVAKLKAKQALDSIPKNKLTLLINYAMRNVYLARNYFAGTVNMMTPYTIVLITALCYKMRPFLLYWWLITINRFEI